MSNIQITMPSSAQFNTVQGLTNRAFDGENIVSGRGATEDQLKFIWDRYTALKRIVDNQAENPQDVVVQELTNRINTLEALLENGCNSYTQAEMQVFQDLNDRVEVLELETDVCCDRGVIASGGDLSGGTDDGANVSVNITWDESNPALITGGQMTATSSSGEQIVQYWFLVQAADGIFVKMRIAAFAGRVLTLDPDTGAISVEDAATGTTIPATAKLFAGATDGAGCEGITTFLATTAPW